MSDRAWNLVVAEHQRGDGMREWELVAVPLHGPPPGGVSHREVLVTTVTTERNPEEMIPRLLAKCVTSQEAIP